MTLESIKDLLHGSLPFTLRMVSGRAIEVPHPDFVALSRSGASIILSKEQDRIEVIRLNQIESFETAGGASNA
ncbi:MAG TPA: hypothetical protein VMM36_03655 [Opitutaceae bacterium]|nr:hypothetical protein [Opitutaceae bacterium]